MKTIWKPVGRTLQSPAVLLPLSIVCILLLLGAASGSMTGGPAAGWLRNARDSDAGVTVSGALCFADAGPCLSGANGNLGINDPSPELGLDMGAVATANRSSKQQARLSAYSSTYSDWQGSPALILRKSHSNTFETLAATGNGEVLGQVAFDGVNSADGPSTGAIIEAVQSGAAGTGNLRTPTDLRFVLGATGGEILALRMASVSGAARVGVKDEVPDFPLDVAGDVRVQGANKLYFGGTGAADNDVSLYRSAANTLKTDDSLLSASQLCVGSTAAGRQLYITSGSGSSAVFASFKSDDDHFISHYSGTTADPNPALAWDDARDLRLGTWDHESTAASWTQLFLFTSTGSLEIAGDLKLGTSSTTCDANARSKTRVAYGAGADAGSGAGDSFQICMKGSDDSYSWRTIYTAP